MQINRLEGDELQYVAESKELEIYFNEVVRQILRDELPPIIEKISKKEWLTTDELSEYTGWSKRTIQYMRDKRIITYSQHGRKILYPRQGLLKFLESHIVAAQNRGEYGK